MRTTTISPSTSLAAVQLISTLAPKSSPFNSSDVFQKAAECFQCQPLHTVIIFSVIILLIIVAGVLGNCFVVGVIVTDRKLLQSSVNLFLLNLALADLGNLVFCTPDALLVLIDKGWILPGFLCPITHFLQEYYLYASVLLQMSIGVERYMAICSPLHMARFTRQTTAYVLIVVWAVAAAFASPYFFFQGLMQHPRLGLFFCFWLPDGLSHQTRMLFRYSESFILYAVPLVLLTVLYTIMGKVLWGGRSANIANETQQMAILKLRKSVVKMLIISMLIYFVCYSPIQGIFLSEVFFHSQVTLSTWLRFFVNVLPVASSSANPIVYIMCCRHFHSRFLSLLSWCCSCCSATYRRESYVTVLGYDGEKALASRSNSRSPYVSFRRSLRNHAHHSVTLL